ADKVGAMDLAAIIIVAARREDNEAAGNNHTASAAQEVFAEIPVALLDVVGKSVTHHVADRLRRAGVEAITALTADAAGQDAILCDSYAQPSCLPADDVWRAAEEAFSSYASEGVES